MNQTAPNVKIIPAVVKPIENTNKYKQLRVAAYCRVSTEQEEQQNSYNDQIAYYTDLINRKKEWTLAGINDFLFSFFRHFIYRIKHYHNFIIYIFYSCRFICSDIFFSRCVSLTNLNVYYIIFVFMLNNRNYYNCNNNNCQCNNNINGKIVGIIDEEWDWIQVEVSERSLNELEELIKQLEEKEE